MVTKLSKKERNSFIIKKKQIEEEINHLNKTLDMLKFKCWYYDAALSTGDEQAVKRKIPEDLPQEIKDGYINSHS